jgi:hypothetical protein
LRAPDEGFGLEGTPKPKIQKDPIPPKMGNLICNTPLYGAPHTIGLDTPEEGFHFNGRPRILRPTAGYLKNLWDLQPWMSPNPI